MVVRVAAVVAVAAASLLVVVLDLEYSAFKCTIRFL